MWYRKHLSVLHCLGFLNLYSTEIMNAHDFHCGMVHRCYTAGFISLNFRTENTKTAWTWVIIKVVFSTFNSDEHAPLSFCRCSWIFQAEVLNYKYEWTLQVNIVCYTLSPNYKKCLGIQSTLELGNTILGISFRQELIFLFISQLN